MLDLRSDDVLMVRLLFRKKRRLILVAVMLMAILTMVACGKTGNREPMDEKLANEDGISVETEYVVLQYQAEFEGKLATREVVQDGVSLVIFSAPMGDQEWELFRIYFNDETVGVQSGYIVLGAEEISVSYDVCNYEDEDFPDESVKTEYYQFMNAFNDVMDSIYNHPQFQKERYIQPVYPEDHKMKYWKVTIPDNVKWQEDTVDGIYKVDFYGEIHEEKVPLYCIALGEMEADYSIGTFLVESGEKAPVHVKMHDLNGRENWTEEDYSVAYRMMESVNDVIQQIMSSEHFSEN